MISCVSVTIASIAETPADSRFAQHNAQRQNMCTSTWTKTKETIDDVWHAIRRLPRSVRRVCLVQLFAFMGWFPFLFYGTTYVLQIAEYERKMKRSRSTMDRDCSFLFRSEMVAKAVAIRARIVMQNVDPLPCFSLQSSRSLRPPSFLISLWRERSAKTAVLILTISIKTAKEETKMTLPHRHFSSTFPTLPTKNLSCTTTRKTPNKTSTFLAANASFVPHPRCHFAHVLDARLDHIRRFDAHRHCMGVDCSGSHDRHCISGVYRGALPHGHLCYGWRICAGGRRRCFAIRV